MKFKDAVAAVVVVIALVSPFALLKMASEPSGSEEIVIRAYVAEAGGFKPNYIIVPQGAKVRLVFESMDVTHGVAIPALGINTAPIKVGDRAVIEFIAEKKGVYYFICSIRCSPYHLYMGGVIVVR